MLAPHSRSFILLAARTLMLDILMLEALLIVDEIPDSNVIHINTEMTDSRSLGLIQDPTWGTRPIDIPEGRWRLMQENLYPSLISITMLDGAKDDLDFRIQLSGEIDHNLLYSSSAITPASSLLESQHLWVIGGIALTVLGIAMENKRRRRAKDLLKKLVSDNMWGN